MKTTQINSISFTKLVINKPNKTAEALSHIVRNVNTFGVVADTFEKIDKNTYDTPVFFNAEIISVDSTNPKKPVHNIELTLSDKNGEIINSFPVNSAVHHSTLAHVFKDLENLYNLKIDKSSLEGLTNSYIA